MKEILKSLLNSCITGEKMEFGDNVDWQKIYAFCEKNRIVEQVEFYFRECIPISQKTAFKSYFRQRKVILLDRLQLLKEIVEIFKKNNISYCLNKGFVFSKLFYNNIFLRGGNDIDFLVQDGSAVIDVLRRYGFQQIYKGIITIPCPVLFDGNAHEYRPLVPPKHPNQLVEIAVSLHQIRGQYRNSLFFDNSHPIHLIDNFFVNTFDLEYQFIYACANIYNDDETSDMIAARNYIDLGRCVLYLYNYINWHRVVQVAEQLQLTHCLYYALNSLDSIVDTLPLKEMLHFIIRLIDTNGFNEHLKKYFVNNICGLNNWKLDLIDRMMADRNTIKAMRKQGLKERNYSHLNPHIHNPIILHYDQKSQIFISNELKFFVEKYNFYLKYYISYTGELLIFRFFLDNNIETILERLTFNTRLFNPLINDTNGITQLDIAWQQREGCVRVKKSNDFGSAVKGFRDLKTDETIKGIKVDFLPNSAFILSVNLLDLGFCTANTPLAFKIYLQEDFVINNDVNLYHNLVAYSDNEVIRDWKNGLSIEYTYPNIIMLTS